MELVCHLAGASGTRLNTVIQLSPLALRSPFCQSGQQPSIQHRASNISEHKMAEKIGDPAMQTIEQVGSIDKTKDVSHLPLP